MLLFPFPFHSKIYILNYMISTVTQWLTIWWEDKFYCINTNALQWPYMTIWLAQPTNQSNNSLKFHTKILKSLKFVALQLHIVLVLNHNLEFPVSTESTYPYLLLHRHLPCLLVIKIINNVTNFVLDTSDTRFLGR